MTARTWVYGQLIQVPGILDEVTGNPRVYAKKSMTSSREETPYIVYKLGNSTDLGIAEDTMIDNQFFQVWVHDYSDENVSDYARIDEVAQQVRDVFFLQGSSADQVWMAQYLETSQDLNDDTLNTVFRYLRFQLIKQGETS